MSKYKITLSKKDALKIIKSVSQQLREKNNQASKVVHQLQDFKDQFLVILSNPFELTPDEISTLESAYTNVPPEIIFRNVKNNASEQLHDIMTTDLNKLLVIQLNNNVNDIQEDKVHLERTLSELDALLESLDEVIKLPECLSFSLWRGADLLVTHVNESSSKEDNPSWTVVKTEYPNELSYVISKSYFICEYFIDYMNKYWFCEMLGNAANNYEGDDIVGLLKSVIDAAKESVRLFHQNFVKNKNNSVADRRIQLFD